MRYNPLSIQWQHLDGQDDLERYYLGLMEESELALLDSPGIIRDGFDLFRLAWSLWGSPHAAAPCVALNSREKSARDFGSND